MNKKQIIHTFLLIFLILTIVLPILSTFLFLAGLTLSGFNDFNGCTFFTNVGLLVAGLWLTSMTILLVLVAAIHLQGIEQQGIEQQNNQSENK